MNSGRAISQDEIEQSRIRDFWDQIVDDLLKRAAFIDTKICDNMFSGIADPVNMLVKIWQQIPQTDDQFIYGAYFMLLRYALGNNLLKNFDFMNVINISCERIHITHWKSFEWNGGYINVRVKTLGVPFYFFDTAIPILCQDS